MRLIFEGGICRGTHRSGRSGGPHGSHSEHRLELDGGVPGFRRADRRGTRHRHLGDDPAGGPEGDGPDPVRCRAFGRVIGAGDRHWHDPGGASGRPLRPQAAADGRHLVVRRRHRLGRVQSEFHGSAADPRPFRARHGGDLHHAVFDRFGIRVADQPRRLCRRPRYGTRRGLSATAAAGAADHTRGLRRMRRGGSCWSRPGCRSSMSG